MSKFLWIASKNTLPPDTKEKVLSICRELVPDNIVVENHTVHISEKVAFGVSNPKNNILIQENSLLVGTLIGEYPKWYVPKSGFPDGSFALFRENKDYIEVVADPAASRTIWYYFDDSILVSATSQLAIVRYLGNFEFNPNAAAWMLSSGTLGPKDSWDKRLQRIMPDCSILLDKNYWSLKSIENPIVFNPGKKSEFFYEKKLKDKLERVFEDLKLPKEDWVLPLSGGYDSRALLFYLNQKERKINKTITWGLENSLKDLKSDAYVASKLAKETAIEHEYLFTDLSYDSIGKVIDRYIKNGEGRIDSISGYLDGFKLWEDLHNKNIQGIIRGDVGWTSDRKIFSLNMARKVVGLTLLDDFNKLKEIFKNPVFHNQLPDELKPLKNESPEEYRDRLYHCFRIPSILAALSDLKLGYIEQISPLLSRNILQSIRNEPEHLRVDKKIFKKIVEQMFPNIPFAENSALESVKLFLTRKSVIEYLRFNLSSKIENNIFNRDLIEKIKNGLTINSKIEDEIKENKKKSFFYSLIPIALKVKLKKRFNKNFDKKIFTIEDEKIAFRILICLKTYELFNKTITINSQNFNEKSNT